MSKIWLLCIACASRSRPQGAVAQPAGAAETDARAAAGPRRSARRRTPAAADAMFAAATKLLASVRGDPEFNEALRQFSMEDELLLPVDDPARRDWSYWPRERAGLKIDLMHAKHRALLQELLWTALSAGGYHKVLNIMQLEYVLQPASTTGFPRGIEEYTITLFGEPSATQPWAWRFEGHHVSLNVSIVPGVGVSVTPTFLGADPAEVAVGPLAGVRVMRAEEDLGRELVTLAERRRNARKRSCSATRSSTPTSRSSASSTRTTRRGISIASNIMKDPKRWEEWREILRPDGIKVAEPRARAARARRRVARRDSRRLPARARGKVLEHGEARRPELCVDRLARAEAAALLPPARPGLRVRVRQRSGQRQPRPRGVAQPRRRLRRRSTETPLRNGSLKRGSS